MRSTTRSFAVVASVLAVLALCDVAASATQNASPTKWVATFCGSVLTWEQTVKTNSSKLKSQVSSLGKGGKVHLPATRAKLVGFMSGLVRATNTMMARIRHIGPPALKDGSKIQKGVLDGFGQVAKAFKQGKKDAQKLPITTSAAFAKASYALASSIQASTNRISEAFGALAKYSTKTLDVAAAKDTACKKL